jgi:hypothetical protein
MQPTHTLILWRVPGVHLELAKKRLPPLARTYRTIMLRDPAKAHTPSNLIVFFRLAGLTLWMCA